MAQPQQQQMGGGGGGGGGSGIQAIKDSLDARFPSFETISKPEMRRTAMICWHCSCCFKPTDSDGTPLFCSIGQFQKCLCCVVAQSFGCCKCKKEWKVWSAIDSTCACCDYRSADSYLCAVIGSGTYYCCCNGLCGCYCNVKEFTFLKMQAYACCLYEGCAIPCDKDVPLECGICGIMIINKAQGGGSDAKAVNVQSSS
eukprot:TRINITY_DN4714_c0_g1_i2.p2 TRINITY_DN4714_c0_g1~~TRINITY_DN4714_c0_g1_i2.p2  ORF type:complete len:221 (+),score=94.81 TRINITY_DN4714_c0_g1_i2:68-664(+)